MPHHQVRCGPCRLPGTEHPKVNGRDHFVREAGIRAHGRDRRMPPAHCDVLHLRQQPTVPVTQLKKPHDDEVTSEPLTKLKPWHYYQNHRRRRLSPTMEGVSAWLAELPAPVAVAYEAGPTGFGLARQLTAAGSGVWWPRRRNCNAHREIG
jgi:hypothetical protein